MHRLPPLPGLALLGIAAAILIPTGISSSVPDDQLVGESLDRGLELASSDPYRAAATADPRVACLPPDPTAPRVEFVFVTSDPDAVLPRADMLETAAWVDRIFADSADHHSPGAFRAVRWHQEEVSPGRCQPVLRKVMANRSGLEQWGRADGSWDRFRSAVLAAVEAGEAQGPRRYLVWADMQHPGYCGHGEMPRDIRPDPAVNLANGPRPRIAVVYGPCHGRVASTEAHELVHTFGAVLPVAPNAARAHCSDHYDRMCIGPAEEVVCDGRKWILDCGGDDYFHPSATLVGRHGRPFWNVADSVFLLDRRPAWWPGDDANPADAARPHPSPKAGSPGTGFADSAGHVFQEEIGILAASGVTRGCDPPDNTRFCPDRQVTRGQMAAFLTRALDLGHGDLSFQDTAGHVFAADISALATAGITRGCSPDNTRFCPDRPVTRGQMAAFLTRALDLGHGDLFFQDTAGHVFAADVSALATAGITRGCNPPHNTRFCPNRPVTRGQMAAFLVRAGLAG